MKYRTPFQILRTEAILEAPPAGGGTPAPTPAPTATPPPAPAILNPDGTFGENWHTALGDNFAPHASSLTPFKNVGDLAKSYLHFRSNGPAYPEANAAPEDVARFRTLARVPEAPEGYNIQPPADIPEGITFDADLAANIAKIAHANHVPAPALQALVDAQFQAEVARHTAFTTAQQEATRAAQDALVAEWGGKFNENSSIVRHHLALHAEAAGIPADSPVLAQLANMPEVSKLMLQVARLTAEDHARTPNGLGDLRSPQERANAIMDGTDPTWSERYKNGDPDAYNTVANLLKQASGQ
jgi:hypothetical protein